MRRWRLASAKRYAAATSTTAAGSASAHWLYDDSTGSGLGLRRWRLAAAKPRPCAAAAPATDELLHDRAAGSGLGLRGWWLVASGLAGNPRPAAASAPDVELHHCFTRCGLGMR